MRHGAAKSLRLGATIVVVATAMLMASYSSAGAQQMAYTPQFNDKGELVLPEGAVWREWPFVGTPVTPNDMNDGAAPFPEFHIVYIDPESWAHWKQTGEFRDGTVLAKVLTRVGSKEAVSGNGYFMGDFSGFEITIKSKRRYPDDPGNWAYYTFGHQPEPYNASAAKQPVEACNACHEAAADDDFVFTQYYPVLRAAKPK
jgi:hypothetical protein